MGQIRLSKLVYPYSSLQGKKKVHDHLITPTDDNEDRIVGSSSGFLIWGYVGFYNITVDMADHR